MRNLHTKAEGQGKRKILTVTHWEQKLCLCIAGSDEKNRLLVDGSLRPEPHFVPVGTVGMLFDVCSLRLEKVESVFVSIPDFQCSTKGWLGRGK